MRLNPNSTLVESPESSSPIVTRAVAAGLSGRYCSTYSFKPWMRVALLALGRLPQKSARFLVSRFQSLSGLPPQALSNLSTESLAADRLNDYAGVPGPFPVITIGAALGGAAAHLASALGGPFLPQAFVVTLNGGSKDGDARAYFNRSVELARQIADQNPNLLTIQHFDPVHDGWITRFANHLRLKLLDLPLSYADFIRKNLQPGGAVCLLDSQAAWLHFRVGERSVFQVGGWGGIPAQEYLEGSPRLRRYCASNSMQTCGWRLDGFPVEMGPESEWGSEPAFGQAIEAFCRQEGFRFVRIALPEPHDYSHLAFQTFLELLKREGRQPSGVLVEMFTQFDATAVQRSGLLPLWLVFNTQDSLAFLREMIPDFPPGKPVFFSPLSTFSLTPDLVPWKDWEAAFTGLEWQAIGARSSHYPSDAAALVNWAAPLRQWAASHDKPIQARIEAEELEAFAELQEHLRNSVQM